MSTITTTDLSSCGPGADPDAGYKFTVAGGAVTAMTRVDGSHSTTLKLPTGATFAVAATSITETLTGTAATTKLTYVQDAKDATLYHLGSETVTYATPSTVSGSHTLGYGFTIANGAVTAMQVTEGSGTRTSTHTEKIGATTTFAVGADGSVTETVVRGNEIDVTTYVKSGTAGLYAVASETDTSIQTGGSATHLSVDAGDRARFTIDAKGTVGAVQQVLADGSAKAVTLGSATAWTQLEAGYVLEVITRGKSASYELYHDGNGDGVYTEAAHGAGSTVDLVGLKAQISAAIDHVL